MNSGGREEHGGAMNSGGREGHGGAMNSGGREEHCGKKELRGRVCWLAMTYAVCLCGIVHCS